MCKSTVHNYLRKNLGLKAYKRKRQPLTEKQRKNRLRFAKKYQDLSEKEWEDYVFSDESQMYLFYEQNRKNDIGWGSQENKVPVAKTVKKSAYVNIWGAMSASRLSAIHFMPQGQTANAEYYVEDILEKEVKPLLKRSKRTNEATTNKMVANKRRYTFQQDGAPAHNSKHAQDWCLQNLPNFINKDDWPGNSLFSILNEKVYCDPEPQTLDELKKRIRKAWREITIHCLSVSNPFCTVCRNA